MLTFIGNQQVATRVDYQTCPRCGFHLMRVETTIISEQLLTVENCSICEIQKKENPDEISSGLGHDDLTRYFDLWLRTHGLDKETLDLHYHLSMGDFFDQID